MISQSQMLNGAGLFTYIWVVLEVNVLGCPGQEVLVKG